MLYLHTAWLENSILVHELEYFNKKSIRIIFDEFLLLLGLTFFKAKALTHFQTIDTFNSVNWRIFDFLPILEEDVQYQKALFPNVFVSSK